MQPKHAFYLYEIGRYSSQDSGGKTGGITKVFDIYEISITKMFTVCLPKPFGNMQMQKLSAISFPKNSRVRKEGLSQAFVMFDKNSTISELDEFEFELCHLKKKSRCISQPYS